MQKLVLYERPLMILSYKRLITIWWKNIKKNIFLHVAFTSDLSATRASSQSVFLFFKTAEWKNAETSITFNLTAMCLECWIVWYPAKDARFKCNGQKCQSSASLCRNTGKEVQWNAKRILCQRPLKVCSCLNCCWSLPNQAFLYYPTVTDNTTSHSCVFA